MINFCVKCLFFDVTDGSEINGKMSINSPGLCRRYPPKIVSMPVQGRIGGIELQISSHYVPVKGSNVACGCFKNKLLDKQL